MEADQPPDKPSSSPVQQPETAVGTAETVSASRSSSPPSKSNDHPGDMRPEPVRKSQNKTFEELGLNKRLDELRQSVKALEEAAEDDELLKQYDEEVEELLPSDLRDRNQKSIPSLNLMTMDKYNERHKAKFSLKQKHWTIDVVMSSGYNPLTKPSSTAADDKPKATKDATAAPSVAHCAPAEKVRFIQINSAALSALLREHAKSDASAARSFDSGEGPITMLAPFKPLCYHIDKLKARETELAEKFAGVTWEKLSAQKTTATAADNPDRDADQQAPHQPPNKDATTLSGQSHLTVNASPENIPPLSESSQKATWQGLKCKAAWTGYKGLLQFSENGRYIHFTQATGTAVQNSFGIRLGNVEKVERTTKTSPVVALRVTASSIGGPFTDEFMFRDAEHAQANMEAISDQLAVLIKRDKASEACKLATKGDENKNAGESSNPADPSTAHEEEEDHPSVYSADPGPLDNDNSPSKFRAYVKGVARIDTVLSALLSEKATWEPLDVSTQEESDAKNFLGIDDENADGFKAFEDLKCLLDFYEQYVQPVCDPLRAKKVKKVRFSDLCLFFRPGDRVNIADEDKSLHRVWCIMKVTGGRPTFDHLLSNTFAVEGDPSLDERSDAAKRSVAPSKADGKPIPDSGYKRSTQSSQHWTTLSLDCYYVDFDGSKLAPIHRRFDIKFFPGLKDPKTLKAQPLAWLQLVEPASAGSILEDVDRDGRRFKDICLNEKGAGEILFYYDGRTNVKTSEGRELVRDPMIQWEEDEAIPATRLVRAEDVSSHVVVDFDKTFQYNPGWKPKFNFPELAERAYVERNAADAPPLSSAVDFVEQSCSWEADWDGDETSKWIANDKWMQSTDESPSEMQKAMDDDDYPLLPDRVYGFVLRTRTWACLSTHPDHLRDVEVNETGWTDLQIPVGHRSTLQSLVKRHFINKRASQGVHSRHEYDIIQGKGRGLIVLLHGAPGLGKTSTAEAIANKYKKPLLPITCGNLGTDAQSVEQALDESFKLAQAWDCILLLDEADVFLAQREATADLERNALVSVFLRTLEYYSGIMFLTTNRVGTFDEAFRSRIHSALFYKDLGLEETVAIWEKSLDRLMKQKASFQQDFSLKPHARAEIVDYADKIWQVYSVHDIPPWNGRQIRNAFQTAVALAEYRASEDERKPVPDLRWTDFQSVILASQDFERYMIGTHAGETDYSRAQREKFRGSGKVTSGNVASGIMSSKVANAFFHNLAQVRPGVIIAPQPPMSDRELDGMSFDRPSRRPTYNDMIDNDDVSQRHDLGRYERSAQPPHFYAGPEPRYHEQYGISGVAQGRRPPNQAWPQPKGPYEQTTPQRGMYAHDPYASSQHTPRGYGAPPQNQFNGWDTRPYDASAGSSPPPMDQVRPFQAESRVQSKD